MKDFSLFEKKFDLKFNNKNLLVQAFVHRSYLNEHPSFELGHNERLEFLGDAVLELIVTEYLFKKYPDKTEGELTSWRAALVNTNQLADVAAEIGLSEFLLLSKGEKNDIDKAHHYILADTFESLIGAIYLDMGYKITRDFIREKLIKELPGIIESGSFKDSKSSFQEKAQEIEGVTPNYKVIKEWGPDHAKKFIVGAFLNDELIAESEGSSKQEAEIKAAEKALQVKNW